MHVFVRDWLSSNNVLLKSRAGHAIALSPIRAVATRAMSSATIAQCTMRSGRSQMRSGTADGCCAVMHSL